MQLEEINVCRGDARHLVGPLCREIRRRKEERIPAAVYRNRIGGIGRPGHDNPRLPRPRDHLICRDNDDCCRAIPNRRSVHQVDRRGNHRRFLELFNGKPILQARVGVVHGIGMRVDRERRKINVLPAVFVHIAAHN